MDILQMVVIFVAVAIMLGIGVAILGSTNIVDCNSLVGSDGTAGKADTDTSWAQQCYEIQEQSTSSYSLLVVILIVVAAVAILSVVRMLG